jgi:hypothetical protein
MDFIYKIINTIVTIVNSVRSLLNYWKTRKQQAIKKEELVIEAGKSDKKIEQAVQNKDLSKLNDLAGWKE